MEHSLTIWSATTTAKLKAWRELRNDISVLDVNSAINAATTWWRTTPAIRRTFDPWKKETWPNPWLLVYQNEHCPNSAVLGIYYTLILAHPDISNIQLAIVNDNEYKHNCLALVIDSVQAILYNKTVDLSGENLIEVLHTFTAQELSNLL